MRFDAKNPPREFTVGSDSNTLTLKDCGEVILEPNEQVTFRAGTAEYDVARKNFGFYATPSINGRLKRFGFRSALVRNLQGQFFVLLVEEKKGKEFSQYLDQERSEVVLWLDDLNDAFLTSDGPVAFCCDGPNSASLRYRLAHHYLQAPKGEVLFSATTGTSYDRKLWECRSCGHVLSTHDFDLSSLYGGDYLSSTYGDLAGVKRTFEKITNLPPGQSDNLERVAYVVSRFDSLLSTQRREALKSVLDIGSGLGVFLHQMKKKGFRCTALDPDPRFSEHARTVVGVEAVTGSLGQNLPLLRPHGIVTLNKVLEHVTNPVETLQAVHALIEGGGFVYVELPDATRAQEDALGFGREEFFVDHHHVFSLSSFERLSELAGFNTVELSRVREPSGKYTLRGILNRK